LRLKHSNKTNKGSSVMKFYVKNLILVISMLNALAITGCENGKRLIVPDGMSRVAINQNEVIRRDSNLSENSISQKKDGITSVEGKTLKIEWKVDANLTLRDNINAWAKSSGWDEAEWLATDEFKAAKTTYIEGEFPEMLKQISDSTGLNICVTRRPKNIKITNHNISCKD